MSAPLSSVVAATIGLPVILSLAYDFISSRGQKQNPTDNIQTKKKQTNTHNANKKRKSKEEL